MFQRLNKHIAPEPRHVRTADVEPAPRSPQQLEELERRQLFEQWRCCEQRVTRAWKTWQAAGRSENGVLYRALMTALADEERAASEVERAFQNG